WSALNLGEVSIALDDPVSAEQHMTHALELMRRLGDQWGTTQALGFTAELASSAGDDERANAIFEELVTRARASADWPFLAQLKIQLAAAAARRHDGAAATKLLDEAGDALRRGGRPAAATTLPYERGVVSLWTGRPASAERLFRASL